jgi:hypothetical protein
MRNSKPFEQLLAHPRMSQTEMLIIGNFDQQIQEIDEAVAMGQSLMGLKDRERLSSLVSLEKQRKKDKEDKLLREKGETQTETKTKMVMGDHGVVTSAKMDRSTLMVNALPSHAENRIKRSN